MLQGHQPLQRSAFVAHEAKRFRRQGINVPIPPNIDNPLGTVVSSFSNPIITPTVPVIVIPTSTVRRTTVTTVVGASTDSSTSTTPIASTTSTSSVTTSSSTTSLSTSALPSTSSTPRPSTSSTLPLSTEGKTNTIFRTTVAPTSAFPTTTADNASASSSGNPSSGISTAGIIGIAAAAIVGTAVVTGLIMFFVRRLRKGVDYDVDNLRRQSVVLGDESASLHRGNSDGYSARPRPPTMIERHYANIVTPPGPTHAPSFGGIRPGEVMPSSGLAPSLPSAARFQQTYYNNSMGQTPIGSPASIAPYGSAYDDQGRIVRTPSNSAASALSRGKSIRDPFNDPQRPSQEEGEYTDLNRASVTPFQAAQYVAISRELNIPPPLPMMPPSAELDKSNFSSGTMLGSPFDDPKGQVGHSVDDGGMQPARASSEFQHHTYGNYVDDSRVASLPPMLSPQQSANMLSPQEELNFPVSPSPLRSEFNISSTNVSALPSPVTTAFARQGSSTSSASPLRYAVGAVDDNKSQSGFSKPPTRRPQSTYEDEDAYGGF